MSAQQHRSDPRILGRRTLEGDHRGLASLLRPGLSVLDLGCGTGAITAGIAKAVGPQASVVGMDRDESLLQIARREHAAIPNLRFEYGDATALECQARFDIVTAARTLQWISEPALAISNMRQVALPNAMLVVLDYNHTGNEWSPDPPREFSYFYRAFLAWRQANGWSNEMADRLPELFRSAGLVEIESYPQDEMIERGQPAFPERASLWSEVIENVGPQLVAAGFCTESEMHQARESCDDWIATRLKRQVLAMRTVTGKVPVSQTEPRA
jgi:ubiquinone/menaquinone biosynthesis C-methylase UbiE